MNKLRRPMNWSMSSVVIVVMLVFMVQPSDAAIIDWVDWTSATTGHPGAATGTVNGISVNYSGELTGAQTSGGFNYFTLPLYTANPVVGNAPSSGDMLQLDLSDQDTITFSTAVTDPIMAIVSLGASWNKVTYAFNAPFIILSYGPGYWGGPGTLTDLGGNKLEGWEGNGVIQFNGTFSSISWFNSPDEYWHGFTFGVPEVAKVPEPSSLLLLVPGLLGAGLVRRKFKK